MLAEVQGQDEGVRYLRRVVEGKFTSPLMLVGEEGTGRRFSAIHAVKETFCVGTREPGCTCLHCEQIDQQIHPDVTVLSAPEDKEIKVDEVRDLIALTMDYPSLAPVRYLIVDGADRMTSAAANSILKTLEEPPSTARFILLTEHYERVIPTIRSRCAKVPYRLLPETFVLSVLHRFEHDHAKALVFARMGEGSVGRAIRHWGSGHLGLRDRVYTFLQHGLVGDLPSLFSAIDAVGNDLPLGLRLLEQLLHDVLMIAHDPTRLINTDIAEGIGRLRDGAKPEVWARFSKSIRDIRDRHRTTRTNLAFHLKTHFAETFSGV